MEEKEVHRLKILQVALSGFAVLLDVRDSEDKVTKDGSYCFQLKRLAGKWLSFIELEKAGVGEDLEKKQDFSVNMLDLRCLLELR